MTQAQFDSRSAALLKAFEREVKRKSIEAAREKFRDEEQLIYVRKHTVQAYFRKRKPRKPRRMVH